MRPTVLGENEILVKDAYPSNHMIYLNGPTSNPIIDEMYGPFPALQTNTGISELETTNRKIEELRNLIQQRERTRNLAQPETLERPVSAPILAPELVTSEEVRSCSEPPVDEATESEPAEIYDGDDMIISDDDDEPVIINVPDQRQTVLEINTPSPSTISIEEEPGVTAENAYVIDDEDDEEDEEMSDLKSDQCASQSSYATADEVPADEVPAEGDNLLELQEKVKAVEEELSGKHLAISKIKETNKELEVKLLKLQVQLSIKRNRKENVKRPVPVESQPTPIAMPSHLYMPPHRTSVQMDENSNNGYHSKKYNKRKKRANKNANNHIDTLHFGYNYNPYYFTHQMPLGPPPPPPPPPPSAPPPSIPPPPPPPPPPPSSSTGYGAPAPTRSYSRVINARGAINQLAEDVNAIAPLADGQAISTFLKDIQLFITLRVNDDKNQPPIIIDRPLPRPCRLVTIDGYTMPMDMIVVDQDVENSMDFTMSDGNGPTSNTSTNRSAEITRPDFWYTSPFFVMLYRKGGHKTFSPVIAEYVDAIMSTLPMNKNGPSFLENPAAGPSSKELLESLSIAKRAVQEHPENEFLAALKVELSLYVNRMSPAFLQDYEDAVKLMPQSVDIRWQRIRAEKDMATQTSLIMEFLHGLSNPNPAFDTPESLVTSSATGEVLIRLLRANRLDKVLDILTNGQININSETVEVFAIDESPSIHITEQDRYNIWMLILYYYATDKKLPDSVCSSWMSSFVKDGTSNQNRMLFMIDWAPALSESPLDRPRQIGVISILLSMLQHFTTKACADTRRRPLLIGVWRTLCNILTFTPCYKRAPTLILIRKGDEIKGLRPELQEMLTELEYKVNNSVESILTRIRSKGRWILPFSQVSAICYRLAKAVYDETKDVCLVARILYIPIHHACDKDTGINLEASPDGQTREEKVVQVDRIRQWYLSVLKLDSLLPVDSNKTKNMASATYPWMSLILLTKISMCLYSSTSPVREGLASQMGMIFDAGMENISSEDGKMIFFKYKTQLTLS